MYLPGSAHGRPQELWTLPGLLISSMFHLSSGTSVGCQPWNAQRLCNEVNVGDARQRSQ